MKNLSILIVDDHEVVRRGLHALLATQAGWEVVGEAANGVEAVKQVSHLNPDIVIMDLTMPEMSGLALLLALRQSGKTISSIVITGGPDASLGRTAEDAGALAVLRKPVPEDELFSWIERALGSGTE